MKGLLIAVVLVIILALVGWISFSTSDSSATITIDKQEIKQDTKQAVRKVEEVTERAVDATKEAVRQTEQEIDQLDEQAPAPQGAP